MKIKFNSNDKLPLNKTIEIPTITIVVRAMSWKLQILGTDFLIWMSAWNIKKNSKDEIKETDIKNRPCYYFDDIIRALDINFDNIL